MFHVWVVGETYDWEGESGCVYFATKELAIASVKARLLTWHPQEQVGYEEGYHYGAPAVHQEWRYAESIRALFLARRDVLEEDA